MNVAYSEVGVESEVGSADDPHAEVSNFVDPGADAVEEDSLSDQPESGSEGTTDLAEGHVVEDVPGLSFDAADLRDVAPDFSLVRPIEEITFGDTSADMVIGHDDRVQIHATNQYPWRVHCSLLITARNGEQFSGTGWFIGPRTVITAGHCVFIRSNPAHPTRDGWAQSVIVMPGRNGNVLPYGSAWSNNIRSVNGWINNGNSEYDYGAILLSTNLGSQTGWLGYSSLTDASLNASTINVSGYPGDKPAGTQWYHYSRLSSVTGRNLYYTADTYKGQSGSAVYRVVNGQRYGVGVHSGHNGWVNRATRITQPVFNNFTNWKA